MKCSEVKNNLVDYAVGSLKSEEITSHIQICKNCRVEFEEIKKVVSVLSEYKIEEPSEFYWAGFLPRVKQKIAQRQTETKLFALKPAFVAPALAIVIIGFLFGLGISNLFVSSDEFYSTHIPDFGLTGVLIEPSEFKDVNTETIEQAVLYLYDKYQIPSIDNGEYDHMDIDVEEILKRISNKF
ncbi:MAG: hypothetical protein RMJ81_06335 [Candidatus Kryptonium sp.]|nr:hypothetical protein [Candidatus Kryptonium sp.]MCX7763122.1 hypothetical protein [Candidatus Kryptonium sp.]MDW8109252.1 hypothetical protein [Candidatus Kryptonium sp.]